MTLYEIDAAIRDFPFEVDEETGELLNADALDELQMAREKKIENVACYIKNLAAEAEAIRAEEKALAERRKAKENRVASLKRYLQSSLQDQPFETTRCKVSFRKTESVDVDAPAFIAWAKAERRLTLLREKFEPDKAAIKNYLKQGLTATGARLVDNVSMTIK